MRCRPGARIVSRTGVRHFRDHESRVSDLAEGGTVIVEDIARNPDAAMAGKLGEVLRSMGQSLEKDARMKGAINMFARRAASGMAASYGSSIVKLVSETVRSWDAQTITNRLEAAVGRDLQYIRINGTLVGGLVGLVLHVIDSL